ncbi:MAG: hypothetical protein E5V66_26455 [Mesorhizobium sp.]|nr:MAG: hypothetical protein E5V66_26455 [Mesorhizobium sp.]TIX70661.1 MAG: hypothetical protein E5V30_13040 [Mesorhizobium sp.]
MAVNKVKRRQIEGCRYAVVALNVFEPADLDVLQRVFDQLSVELRLAQEDKEDVGAGRLDVCPTSLRQQHLTLKLKSFEVTRS